MIPDAAEALIDVRTLPGTEDAALEDIRRIVGDDIEVEIVVRDIGLEVPFDGDLVDAMVAALGRADPGVPVIPYLMGGGTDNKALASAGHRGLWIRAPAAARRPRLHRHVPRRRRARSARCARVRAARADRPAPHVLIPHAHLDARSRSTKGAHASRGDHPRPRPGTDRVPADLIQCAPAHPRRVPARRAGPGCRVHGDHADRNRGGGRAVLLAGHRAHHHAVVPGAVRQDPAQRPGRAHGLADHHRKHPDRRARAAVPGRDRDDVPLALARRGDAHLLRRAARHRRPRRCEEASAEGHHHPARHHLRLRAGAGPHPRRVTLGRNDHRRPLHGLRACRRGAIRVPARDPRGFRQRLLPAVQELGRAGRASRSERPRSPRSSRSSWRSA